MKKQTKPTPEFENFTNLTKKLLSVPKSEVERRAKAEKQTENGRKSPSREPST